MLEKLGKYKIMEQIGKGSMGKVYKAKDQNIGRIVAIKTIKLPDATDAEKEELVRRFKQEAMAAGNLNHPNIVVIYEYDEVDDIAFIAMEYIEGVELKKYFDNNEVFSQDRIIEIMTQLMDALEYSHLRGVIHRDIKPSNIMITPSGQVKVTDFGIARLESSELTQAGATLGTPSYMSPEQCTGQAIDARSDLFSSGVLLYQLLTGEKPFTGPSITAILHKITQVSPPPPSKLNFGVSPGFDPVLEKCLAKRPEDRYPSAADLSKALSALTGAPALAGRLHQQTEPADEDATTLIEPLAGSDVSLSTAMPQDDATMAIPPDDATVAIPLGGSAGSGLRDHLLDDATVVAPVNAKQHLDTGVPPATYEHRKKHPTDSGKDTTTPGFTRWLNRYTSLGAVAVLIVAAAVIYMMKKDPTITPPGGEQEPPVAAQTVPPAETPAPQKTEDDRIGQDTQTPPPPAEQQGQSDKVVQEATVDTDIKTGVEESEKPDIPLFAEYKIISVPPGASIELEPRGVLDSVTPLEVKLPLGAHQLYVKKEGYHDMSIVIDVLESGNNQLQLKLRPM